MRKQRKNRRRNRGHVLDVSMRRQQARATRWRHFLASVSIAVGTLLVLFGLLRGIEWVYQTFIKQNEAFALKHIDIKSDGSISPSLLRRWAGVRPKDNLFMLDLKRIQRDLEWVPMIASASVQRVFPQTLKIRVVERVPCAEVRLPRLREQGVGVDKVSFFVDASGYVFQYFPEAFPDLPHWGRERPWPRLVESRAGALLPDGSGVQRSVLAELVPGRVTDEVAVLAALRLLRAFEASPLAHWVRIVSIDVSDPEPVALQTTHGRDVLFRPTPDVIEIETNQGSRITVAVEGIPAQVERWEIIYRAFAGAGERIRTLDLSVTNNIPLTLFQPGGTQPVSAGDAARPLPQGVPHA